MMLLCLFIENVGFFKILQFFSNPLIHMHIKNNVCTSQIHVLNEVKTQFKGICSCHRVKYFNYLLNYVKFAIYLH